MQWQCSAFKTKTWGHTNVYTAHRPEDGFLGWGWQWQSCPELNAIDCRPKCVDMSFGHWSDLSRSQCPHLLWFGKMLIFFHGVVVRISEFIECLEQLVPCQVLWWLAETSHKRQFFWRGCHLYIVSLYHKDGYDPEASEQLCQLYDAYSLNRVKITTKHTSLAKHSGIVPHLC